MHKGSRLILGTMRLGSWGANYDTKAYHNIMQYCLEQGISTIDLADIYGDYSTESDIGRVLKGNSSLRTQLQLITKCGIRRVCAARPQHRIKSYDSSGAHIRASVEESLRQLQTDYIDTLLLHRPDFLMNPDEVASTFADLKAEGKVLQFGVSNFSATQFSLLSSRTLLVTNQIEASIIQLASFQDGTLDQCLQDGIAPMAWSPLGGGSPFAASASPRIQRIRAVAAPLCQQYNLSFDQLLLTWLLSHPAGIRPVLGTTKIARIQSAVAVQHITLNRTDWYDLWQASTGQSLP